MKTKFESCPVTEIERIVHASCVTASGFYNRNGFVVLPKTDESCREVVVVIPDADFRSIPYYWQRVMVIPTQFPIAVPHDLVRDLEKLVGKEAVGVTPARLNYWIESWQRVDATFWQVVSLFFPEEIGYVKQIEVRVSKYGTSSSFSFLERKRGQKLIVYVRDDSGVAEIAESIVTALLYPDRELYGFSWSRREAIVDFFMTRKEMRGLFPHYKPTLSGMARVTMSLKEKSELHMRKIGVIYGQRKIEILSGILFVQDRNVDNEFGPLERKVIGILCAKQGELVTFDEIEDAMWGVGEMKSLWAITKLLQRIRKKFVKIGLPANCLRTLRGRGYVLES